MKCRACWADKAYVREVPGWRGVALSWLGLVPMKCHHCYHKFNVLWLFTFGKQMTPPALKVTRPIGEPAVLRYPATRAAEAGHSKQDSSQRKAA